MSAIGLEELRLHRDRTRRESPDTDLRLEEAMTVLSPRDAKDVEEAVRWALEGGRTLDVIGTGSKRGLGRPCDCDAVLDLSALTGVTLYEPDELVLSARAGTPLAEIAALVAAQAQELAFEPADYGGLYGAAAGGGTIGGVVATNLSGPRRIKAGAARDHFLGVAAVSGRAETFKSGGRVVKNVTGYDLCKLLAGSFGTLAVMTDVTVKVLPRAETETSLVLSGLDDAMAAKAMAAAMGSSCDVSGAAHLPAAAVGGLDVEGIPQDGALTLLRLEGVPESVRPRAEILAGVLADIGGCDRLGEAVSRAAWRAVRDVRPFALRPDGEADALWRISTAPMQGPALADALRREAQAQVFYDWAGGLVWASVPDAETAGAAAVERAVTAHGGHAMLVRAPEETRRRRDLFTAQSDGVATLSRRVKDGFDPQRLLNPGRIWQGL